MSKVFFPAVIGLSALISFGTGLSLANDGAAHPSKRRSEVEIKVVAAGPTQAQIDAAKSRVSADPSVRAALKGGKNRLVEFTYFEEESKIAGVKPPVRFNAVFYDYTNFKTFIARGDLEGRERIVVSESTYQPVPSNDEFEEAVAIIKRDSGLMAEFGSAPKVVRPMPPVTAAENNGERLINVGLLSRSVGKSNEIVSVSIGRGVVNRYPEKAPFLSKAAVHDCGPPSAGQPAGQRGLAGQAMLTVIRGGQTLWEMEVIRPSASSGGVGSGIELKNVRYRGKSVLKRGHVPVLNVQYDADVCGPYRDWQFSEDWFSAPEAGADDRAPGIRVLANGQVATTVIETGVDQGNFQGVAIYTQNSEFGTETVLVTEMNAGWYRYIMEWRFADDGTIRPRFGFDGVANACVCATHHHHAYWRFDFDVVSPVNSVFQVERGRKFQRTIPAEINFNKNHQTRRSVLVQNAFGDEAYLLVPNLSDGTVDAFGRNDFWVLKYKNVDGGTAFQNEFDDGTTLFGSRLACSQGLESSCINLQRFVTGESLVNQDVVVWYGAHFTHDEQHEHLLDPDRSGKAISGTHVVGPDLRPVRW